MSNRVRRHFFFCLSQIAERVAIWKPCLPQFNNARASEQRTGPPFTRTQNRKTSAGHSDSLVIWTFELMAGWLNDNSPVVPSPSRAPSDDRKQTALWHFSLISIISIQSLCGWTVPWQGSNKGYSADLWWTTPAVRNYPFHWPKGWRQRVAPCSWEVAERTALSSVFCSSIVLYSSFKNEAGVIFVAAF